jgi:hypothetical protein
MLSRIFWVGLAAIALITSMIIQDGDRMLSWGDSHDLSAMTEGAIEAKIERAVARGVDRMEVVDSGGREIVVPPDRKRALADAIGRLIEAETDLAVLRVRDGSAEKVKAASALRDKTRAEVDALKAEIERREDASIDASVDKRDVARDEIRREIREDVRDAVRDTVGN